jgi:hypothetical protein
MTRTFGVNASNDLFIGDDGNLTIVTGLEAVQQACAQAAKTLLGEMILATDQGIPYFDAVWSGDPDTSRFEAALRIAILDVEGVTEVTNLTIVRSGDQLAYTAEIASVYGPGAVSSG